MDTVKRDFIGIIPCLIAASCSTIDPEHAQTKRSQTSLSPGHYLSRPHSMHLVSPSKPPDLMPGKQPDTGAHRLPTLSSPLRFEAYR